MTAKECKTIPSFLAAMQRWLVLFKLFFRSREVFLLVLINFTDLIGTDDNVISGYTRLISLTPGQSIGLVKVRFFLTYPPPTMRLLSSPAINRSVVLDPSFSSPLHKYLIGLGLSRKTKLSPVPK